MSKQTAATMSKITKSLSQQLRDERLKIEASAIPPNEKTKKPTKYTVQEFQNRTQEKIDGILSGTIVTPIVKKKFRECGKRGPKPKETNRNLMKFHYHIERELGNKLREFSMNTGVSIRKVVETGIRTYLREWGVK